MDRPPLFDTIPGNACETCGELVIGGECGCDREIPPSVKVDKLFEHLEKVREAQDKEEYEKYRDEIKHTLSDEKVEEEYYRRMQEQRDQSFREKDEIVSHVHDILHGGDVEFVKDGNKNLNPPGAITRYPFTPHGYERCLQEEEAENKGEMADYLWRMFKGSDLYAVYKVENDQGQTLWYDKKEHVWVGNGSTIMGGIAYEMLGEMTKGAINYFLGEFNNRIKNDRCKEEGVEYPYGVVPQEEFDFKNKPGIIPLKNGNLHLDELEMHRMYPDDFFLWRLPTIYLPPEEPAGQCPRWAAFLEETIPDEDQRKTIQEYVGYMLMHWAKPHHKVLFIVGPTRSGKSTIVNVLEALFGDVNTSVSPQQAADNEYYAESLRNKWTNMRNDISAKDLRDPAMWKAIVAGDTVKARAIYDSPTDFQVLAKAMYTANELPMATSDDDAVLERYLVISAPNTVPDEDIDPRLKEKLIREKPGILNWAIKGYKRLIDQDHFTHDPSPGEIRAKWSWRKASEFAISDFIERHIKFDGDEYEVKSKLYQRYKSFCHERGVDHASQTKFGREMNKIPAVSTFHPKVGGRQMGAYKGVKYVG